MLTVSAKRPDCIGEESFLDPSRRLKRIGDL